MDRRISAALPCFIAGGREAGFGVFKRAISDTLRFQRFVPRRFHLLGPAGRFRGALPRFGRGLLHHGRRPARDDGILGLGYAQ